jgi:hypothetical protein
MAMPQFTSSLPIHVWGPRKLPVLDLAPSPRLPLPRHGRPRNDGRLVMPKVVVRSNGIDCSDSLGQTDCRYELRRGTVKAGQEICVSIAMNTNTSRPRAWALLTSEISCRQSIAPCE